MVGYAGTNNVTPIIGTYHILTNYIFDFDI